MTLSNVCIDHHFEGHIFLISNKSTNEWLIKGSSYDIICEVVTCIQRDSAETRCVGTIRMSPPWILRRLANVSPLFNSLSNRLRITNYSKNQVNISNQSEKKWWQLNIWPNFKAQWLQVGQKSFNRKEFQRWSVTYDYTLSYQKSSQYLKS